MPREIDPYYDNVKRAILRNLRWHKDSRYLLNKIIELCKDLLDEYS